MALKWSRVVAEVALAFGGGVVWFALSAALLGGLPSSAAVVGGMTVLDVLAVLAVAHYWGIHAAVPVGVASVVALDWHYIPPTHDSAVPDGRNAAALAVYLIAGVLLGQLALAARRRAEVSERARALLADEQAALRRVATLVARETSPAEVFAAVTEEVGRLLVDRHRHDAPLRVGRRRRPSSRPGAGRARTSRSGHGCGSRARTSPPWC